MATGGAADTSGVSVVICTRNRPLLLAGALAAARSVLRPGDEVVVVDSASDTAETREVAAAAGCRVVRVERPGLSVARNAGVAATERPIIAFTDDDCMPEPGWAGALATAFADPRVGVVFGRLVAESADGPIPTHDPGPQAFAFGSGDDPARVGAGACMAFRRDALEAAGGFDEVLGAGTPLRSGEDHDAAWRVLRTGWAGRYEPGAQVVHREWRDPWQLVRMQWGYGLGAGAVAAKIARVDRAEGWAILGRRLGRDGVARVVSNLAHRWERPALASLLYTVGVAAGAVRVWRRPVDRGRFRVANRWYNCRS